MYVQVHVHVLTLHVLHPIRILVHMEPGNALGTCRTSACVQGMAHTQAEDPGAGMLMEPVKSHVEVIPHLL